MTVRCHTFLFTLISTKPNHEAKGDNAHELSRQNV